MKKLVKFMSILFCFSLLLVGVTACNKEEEKATFKVEFMDQDQTTVLKTEEVEGGALVEGFTPENKADAIFAGWFATPNFSRKFDFTKPITKDTIVFSKWESSVEDTRDWYLLGEFKYEKLANNNWGANIDNSQLVKVDGKVNTYEITVNLYQKDVFQIVVLDLENKDPISGNPVWLEQLGYGMVEKNDNFEDAGNIYDPSAAKHNIRCLVSGQYTISIKTDVADINASKITLTRIGDAPSLEIKLTPSVIGTVAGGALADLTANPDLAFGDRLEANGKITMTANVSLNKGELVIVSPFNAWNVQLKASSVDYNKSDNVNASAINEIEITATGSYKITLVADEKVEEDTTEQTKMENYSVIVNKVSDEYVKATGVLYDEYNINYNDGEGNDYVVYLRNGARFPQLTNPTLTKGNELMGWGTVVEEKEVGIGFQQAYTTTGATYEVNYRTVNADTDDLRDFFVKGDGVTINGEALTWNSQVSLTKTDKNTYEIQFVISTTGQFQVNVKYLGTVVGTSLRYSNVVNPGDFLDSSNQANIAFKTAGTYKMVLNSVTSEITIEKLA